MNSRQHRVPAGTPTGGQYATTTGQRANVDLATTSPQPAIVPLGQIVATNTVVAWQQPDTPTDVERINFVRNSLRRHQRHDWGDVDADDSAANDAALNIGARIVSSYKIPPPISGDAPDPKIWIITEADRSATTVLFPRDY